MRRTSFIVVMSTMLTDAPAELTMKAIPPAFAGSAAREAPVSRQVTKQRDSNRKRRRMAWESPAGWRGSLRHKRGIGQGYSGIGRANTAVAKANITQAG